MAGISKSLTIAISGCTSSGKTTLTATLRVLLPPRTIFLHADVFGRSFEEMPIHAGFADCDSRQSLRFDDIKAAIDFTKSNGRTPKEYQSFGALDADLDRATRAIEPSFLDSCRGDVEILSGKLEQYETIIVVDGFLMFHDESLRDRFDVMLLLRASRDDSWSRRSMRYGDLREEEKEFWQTSKYFESCVWHNYELEHGFLFPGGNVEQNVDTQVLGKQHGVLIQPKQSLNVQDTHAWALRIIRQSLSEI